ncbi:hypothetical protein BHE74_00030484 [Ensete ventricosum]|nr:hypothetical protein GW17_00019499 [Ensete ventricosum]RWW62389.1 hypothetical protein BHE74_00030484 [Ensete ventricosum]RZR94208.1 hypothetical protein BHM03_00022876 [Ensete ventricosum]
MNLLPGADVSSVEDGEEEEDVSSAGSAMELFPQRAGFVPSLAAVAEDARISARAPYHVAASPETVNPVKQEKSGSWLGLGPQFSFPSLSLSSEHTR